VPAAKQVAVGTFFIKNLSRENFNTLEKQAIML
jgi:hypothetical protein